MKKFLYLLLMLLFVVSCQRKEILKTHGISYLENREKLIIVNETNKNDVVSILGQPSTKGMTDNNVWIYIEYILLEMYMLYYIKLYRQCGLIFIWQNHINFMNTNLIF